MVKVKKVPDAGMETKPTPIVGIPENTVVVAGVPLEIKPTKLKYVRNGTANFYKLLEFMSLVDIVQLQSGAFGDGDERDGDKALMDWLISATDNEEFVTTHYDEFDTEQIARIHDIFKRVNKFPGKEEDLKNAESPRTEA